MEQPKTRDELLNPTKERVLEYGLAFKALKESPYYNTFKEMEEFILNALALRLREESIFDPDTVDEKFIRAAAKNKGRIEGMQVLIARREAFLVEVEKLQKAKEGEDAGK